MLDERRGMMTAFRIRMQAICNATHAEAIAEYLHAIPGFYALEPPQALDRERTRLDFSVVVREELKEGTLLHTAEERVGQYLWQRPDVQPVELHALAHERLPEAEEAQLPPDYIPPRRSL
jgi:hypothetical protein